MYAVKRNLTYQRKSQIKNFDGRGLYIHIDDFIRYILIPEQMLTEFEDAFVWRLIK